MKFWIPNNEIIYKFPEWTHSGLAIIGAGFLYLAYRCLKYLDHFVMNNSGVCKTGPFKYLRHPLYLALGTFYLTAPEISKGSIMFIVCQLTYVIIAVFTL